MADNVDITPGAGKTIAADEILGILFQRLKLTLGDDGVNGGDVSVNNPMPSKLVGDQATMDVSFPAIVVPNTGSNVKSAPGSVQAQIVPGGTYTFCLSTITTLGTTANTMSSCGTTSGSTAVTYTGTAPQLGQLLAGTGITPGSYVEAVNPGVGFTMSLPATATGSITVNVTAGYFTGIFESSADGTTWNPISPVRKSYFYNADQTASAVAPGLYQYQSSNTDRFLRFTVQTIGLTGVAGNATAHAIRIDIDAMDRSGSIINLPYVQYVAATATTFPTGIPLLMPVDMTGLSFASIGIQTITGTSQTLTFRQSSDNQGAGFLGHGALKNDTASNTLSATTTSAGEYILGPSARYAYAFWSSGTAVTAMAITGCVAHTGAAVTTHQVVMMANTSVNVGQMNGQAPAMTAFNGASNRGMTNGVAGPVANTDYNAQAWAAASGTGGTIADSTGGGLGAAFDVNLTAWTAGSSLGLTVYLQESPDNGTTWYDIWQCDEMTAVSRRRIPALPIAGRRRMRWVNRGGAATTATVTVICMDLSGWPVRQVQWFDRTASVTNGTAGLGNGGAYDIAGIKAMTCVISTGSATGAASFKVQMSLDGTDWYDASAAVSCPANSFTPIPLTAGIYGRHARFVCTVAGTSAVINYGSIYGTN